MHLTTEASPTLEGDSKALPRAKKVYHTEFVTAHRACRTPADREQLAAVIAAGWKEAELTEYARLYCFSSKKDRPTAGSYLTAISYIVRCDDARQWRTRFRKGGSKPLPPRSAVLLRRGKGLTGHITSEEYSWPDHTEEHRSMIEQRCREYFKLPAGYEVHVNAWAASQRAYYRELDAEDKAALRAHEAVALVLSPKVLKKSQVKAPRRKIVSSVESGVWCDRLKPHFHFDFPHHTPEFREEVTALARQDRRLSADAPISPHQWKITCNKHYCLIESNQA